MTTKNEDLIKRVREALKIDLREMDAIFTPLLTDVLAALEESEFPDNGKVTPFQRKSLMFALGAPGTSPSEGQVVADAMDRMEKAPPSCLANYNVRGDRATLKVKDAVAQADECGFRLAEDVGYGSIVVIAKVIMLHITRVFGVTAARMEESGSREGGLIIEFNRELTEPEADALCIFLGQE